MDNKKKTIVTLWIGTTILLALFFFLPDKASNYFLSLRVLNNEKKIVQVQAAEKKNVFPFLRNDKDDARMLGMLEQRTQNDRKWLIVYAGLIVLVINTLACLLYIFNMKPVIMSAWILGYLLITGAIILKSYISISP
jgi:hypothetical protein